jgi:Fe-S cluster assembly protein SufD
MTPLLQSFAKGFAALPAAQVEAGRLGDARRAALGALLADGLPAARSERWKYTTLRAFERRTFAAAAGTGIDPELLAAIPAPRMVFVNGRFDAGLSQLDALPDGVSLRPLSQVLAAGDAEAVAFVGEAGFAADEPFARLNAAMAADGVLLSVAAGCQLHAAMHLVFVGAAGGPDAAWHLASRIDLAAGAGLCLVEHHLAQGEHAHLCTSRQMVTLADGARLSHARVQDESAAASLFTRTDATLAAGADYRRVDLELGSALSRHELNVALAGRGARLTAHGVLLADGRRHLDTRLGIRHVAPDTTCDLVWRGLGAARGRAVFHGGITIHEGADGSNAALSNKNLLLSAEAEIDTQPVLVIHADEVKAAHGATVGQLDATAMFYLRSRGLPADEARRLLTVAFCREPLAALEDSALSATLAAHLDARLHSGGAL